MDLSKLQGHLPDDILLELPDVCDKFGITTEMQLALLLGQCKQESGFSRYEENLNYSTERLMVIWPKIFQMEEVSAQFAHNPEKIANEVYSNLYGNGDRESGDGWTFRGRGAIGITFRANYQQMADDTGIDVVSDPDSLAADNKLIAAGWYWMRFLQKYLDNGTVTGVTPDDVKVITRHVNAGLLGLDNRIKFTQEFYALLTT